MIYRGPGFLASLPPLPLSVSSTGNTHEDWERESAFWRERGRGWGRSQIIQIFYAYSLDYPILGIRKIEGLRCCYPCRIKKFLFIFIFISRKREIQYFSLQCSGSGSVGSVRPPRFGNRIRNYLCRYLHDQAKKIRKTLISTVLWFLYLLLSLKIYVNVL